MAPTTRPRLVAENRTITGKHVARLRREGKLPAVVYGHGVESRNVTIDTHAFEQLRRHSGPNTLFDLTVDSARATPTLVHSVQVHPVTRRPLHVDLLAVRMTEELVVEVPVVFVGLSSAVEMDGGTLSHPIQTIRVRALPDHLPQSVEVSVEALRTFDDAIHVRDLTIPSDVTVLTDADEVVARVLPPRVEVESAAEAPAEAEVPASSADGGAESGAEAASS